jgi:hypothetical protein
MPVLLAHLLITTAKLLVLGGDLHQSRAGWGNAINNPIAPHCAKRLADGCCERQLSTSNRYYRKPLYKVSVTGAKRP